MRRLLALLVVLPLLLSGSASAESVNQVATALKSHPVYESPGLDLIDEDALASVLDDDLPKLDVAVLPETAASSATEAAARADAIGSALRDTNAVILVITANRHLGAAAGKGARNAGISASTALRSELARSSGVAFDKEHLTEFVRAYKQRLDNQLDGGSPTGDSSQATSDTKSGGRGGLVLLLVLGGLIGGGVLLASRSARRKTARANEAYRADAEQLYNRLGSEVNLLGSGDDPVSKQALADAAERYNACGSTLATADSPAEFAAARRTAVEGLTAARVARKQLGLDPGPEIPLPAGSGPQLTEEQQLELGGQTFEGSPDYRPGRQHYYGGGNVGGRMVPGGWYSAPFWEPFLLGSLLSGGFGGFGDHGGYERGYQAGHADSADAADVGGGDWAGPAGDVGGGDWGGGGGGGDAGGGDW